MVEIRRVKGAGLEWLEYRYVTPNVDASGALCPPGEWSAWKMVETVEFNAIGGPLRPDQRGKNGA